MVHRITLRRERMCNPYYFLSIIAYFDRQVLNPLAPDSSLLILWKSLVEGITLDLICTFSTPASLFKLY